MKFLTHLDLSGNNVEGGIPSSVGKLCNLEYVDISSNKLDGTLPEILQGAHNCLSSLQSLDFSNLFEGPIPCPTYTTRLLDLSNNKFFGPIPSDIGDYDRLKVIDLSKNNLSGKIPLSLGQLTHLQILHLSDNNLSGEIPETFRNLSSLETLDLGKNRLTGKIPQWIGGGFESLEILNLRSNSFSGELPSSLSNLSSLQILDVSGNHGVIPENISNLTQLESLDFSSNRLSGPIPQSFGSLSFLQYLNLSNNDFSGKIPYKDHMTTFEAPSFAGNPRLCGPPLVVTCPGDNKDGNSSKGGTSIGHHDSFVDNWFPLSVGLGFAAGLLVPFLVMAITKSWGDAYFGLVNKVFERIALFTYRMRRATP
ncbi:hypothetical protein UlMin_007242 [Ulmus minor]